MSRADLKSETLTALRLVRQQTNQLRADAVETKHRIDGKIIGYDGVLDNIDAAIADEEIRLSTDKEAAEMTAAVAAADRMAVRI